MKPDNAAERQTTEDALLIVRAVEKHRLLLRSPALPRLSYCSRAGGGTVSRPQPPGPTGSRFMKCSVCGGRAGGFYMSTFEG